MNERNTAAALQAVLECARCFANAHRRYGTKETTYERGLLNGQMIIISCWMNPDPLQLQGTRNEMNFLMDRYALAQS
jgi:hypothetical protein